MRTHETQIKPVKKDYSLQPITEHILGFGFLETVYHRMRGAGIRLGYLINFERGCVEYKRMVF